MGDGDAFPPPPREEVASVVGSAWGLPPAPTPTSPATGGGHDGAAAADPLPVGTRVALAVGAVVVAAVVGGRAALLCRTRLISLRHHPATGAVRAYTYHPSGRAGLALAAEAPAGAVGVDHAALRRAAAAVDRLRWGRAAGAGATPSQRAAEERAATAVARSAAVLTLAVDAGAAGTRAFTVDVAACEVFEGQRLAAVTVDRPKDGRGTA